MLAVCKKITKSNYAYMKRPDPRSAAHTVSVGLVHDGSLLIIIITKTKEEAHCVLWRCCHYTLEHRREARAGSAHQVHSAVPRLNM